MHSHWSKRSSRVAAIACALVAGAASLPGCGGKELGPVAPSAEDAEANTARNKSMEDFMKSPAGKKSAAAR